MYRFRLTTTIFKYIIYDIRYITVLRIKKKEIIIFTIYNNIKICLKQINKYVI